MDVKAKEKLWNAIKEIKESDPKDPDFVEFSKSLWCAYGLDVVLRIALIDGGADGISYSIEYANRMSGIDVEPKQLLFELRTYERNRRLAIKKSTILWILYYYWSVKNLTKIFMVRENIKTSYKMAVTCLPKKIMFKLCMFKLRMKLKK